MPNWRNNAAQTVCEKHIISSLVSHVYLPWGISPVGGGGGGGGGVQYIGSVGQARVSPPPPASLHPFAGTCHAVQWVARICTLVLALVPDFCLFVIVPV